MLFDINSALPMHRCQFLEFVVCEENREREIYIAVFQEALIDPHIFFLSEEVLMIDKYLAKELHVSIDDNLQGLFHVSVPQRHCRTATNTVADIALKRGT